MNIFFNIYTEPKDKKALKLTEIFFDLLSQNYQINWGTYQSKTTGKKINFYYMPSFKKTTNSDERNIYIIRNATHPNNDTSIFWTKKNPSFIYNKFIPILVNPIISEKEPVTDLFIQFSNYSPAAFRNKNNLYFCFDILFNIFFHLYPNCRLEDDNLNYAQTFFSATQYGDLSKPWINYLLESFVLAIEHSFTIEIKKKRKKPEIVFTHDVDALALTCKLRAKSLVHTLVSSIFNRNFSLAEYLKWISIPDSFNQIKPLIQLEKSYNIKSIFFWYIKTKHASLQSILFNPDYDIRHFQREIEYISKENYGNGLHGSYNSSIDEKLFAQEKLLLEKYSNKPITDHRFHWYHLKDTNSLAILEENDILRDYSFGTNNQLGFRNAICSPFKLMKPSLESFYKTEYIPTIIMDSIAYRFYAKDKAQTLSLLTKIIDEVSYFNGKVAILWHQRVFNQFYNWKELYTDMIQYLQGVTDFRKAKIGVKI